MHEGKIDSGYADCGLGEGIHNLRYLVLCARLTHGDGEPVLDPGNQAKEKGFHSCYIQRRCRDVQLPGDLVSRWGDPRQEYPAGSENTRLIVASGKTSSVLTLGTVNSGEAISSLEEISLIIGQIQLQKNLSNKMCDSKLQHVHVLSLCTYGLLGGTLNGKSVSYVPASPGTRMIKKSTHEDWYLFPNIFKFILLSLLAAAVLVCKNNRVKLVKSCALSARRIDEEKDLINP